MSTAPPIKRSLSKTINAPTEKVFDSWLIPAVVGRWMFGPVVQQETVVDLTNNVRPKGDFSYTVKRAGKDIVISGEYQVIDRPRRLQFSWREQAGNESSVQVQFEPDESRTKMKITLLIDGALSAQADAIKQVWSQRSMALATLLAKKT